MNKDEILLDDLKYFSILLKHGWFNRKNEEGMPQILADYIRVFESIPIILESMINIDMNTVDRLVLDETVYDSLKFLANLCIFTDAVLPIVNKYNPSKEDRAKFVEFIKNMEGDDDRRQ